MINTQFFADRTLLNELPLEVYEDMMSRGLIAPDNVKAHFCGIISHQNGLAVFLPRNHGLNEDIDLHAAGHFLLKALMRYFRDKHTGIYAQDNGTTVIGGQAFSLITELLDDYQVNGLYIRRVKEHTINSGKVNWPRTIARSTPYPSYGTPIYIDLETSRSRYLANCETAKIHAQVMRELINTYGELWFGSYDLLDERLLQLEKPLASTSAQIAYLERELRLTYSERDMFLIKGLIKYLRTEKGLDTNNLLIGVRKFHTLWETMLDDCLVGKYKVNDKLPVPVYQTIENDFIKASQKGQRTDTVLKHSHKNRYAVIDAKYYEASSIKTAPGWPDLVKQFFYQKAVQELEGDDATVSNHFIFPGNEAALKSVHVAERGIDIDSDIDCLDEYKPIHCHYQDPIELLKVYVKRQKLYSLTENIFSF